MRQCGEPLTVKRNLILHFTETGDEYKNRDATGDISSPETNFKHVWKFLKSDNTFNSMIVEENNKLIDGTHNSI